MGPEAGDTPIQPARTRSRKREHVRLYKEEEDREKLELLQSKAKLPSFPLSLAPETGKKDTRIAEPERSHKERAPASL